MDLNYLITIQNPLRHTNSIIFDTKHLIFANKSQVHIKKIDNEERYVRIKSKNHDITQLGFLNNKVVIGNKNGQLIVHKITDLDRKIQVKAHFNSISALATKEGLIVTGGHDKLIKIWDVRQLTKPLKIFQQHKNWVTAVDLGSKMLISGSHDKSVKVWDLKTYKLEMTYDLDSQIDCVRLSQNQLLSLVATKKYLIVIDNTKKIITQCYPLKEACQNILCLSEDLIATCHQQQIVQLYDLTKAKMIDSPDFDKNLKCVAACKFHQYFAILTPNNATMYEVKLIR